MAEEKSGGIWERFPGKDPNTPALPDFYSNYFDYSFDRTEGDLKYVGLRIKGEFAYARYMSFNIYDAQKGASYGALTDFQIKPLPLNVNPYVAGSDASAENRSYSITVMPGGYSTGAHENALTFKDSEIDVLTVMLRYYVPHEDALLNVRLPEIKAFDVRTGKPVELPQVYPLRGSMPKAVLIARLLPVFATADNVTLRFYHAGGAGQFNNADNMYLITAVREAEGAVLLIRVKPPSYPRSNDEYGSTDVRYWSFNEGNADTSTPFGMKDEDFKTAKDGFVYIAIGDESIRSTAQERGYNFMPWRAERAQAVVLYRNLVTNPRFRGRLSKVPEIEPRDLANTQNLHALDAKNYIGDYAPTGKRISQELFMRGGGQTGAADDIIPPRE